MEEYPLELRLESEVVLLFPLHVVGIGTCVIVNGLRYCIPAFWLVDVLLIGETLPAKQDIDLASFIFGEESASDSNSDIGVIVIDGPSPPVISKVFGLFV